MTDIDEPRHVAIRRVIAQEQATVAQYTALIKSTPTPRLKALRAYHKAQVKRWKGELRNA